MSEYRLNATFRNLSAEGRFAQLCATLSQGAVPQIQDCVIPNKALVHMADTMTECAIGVMAVPLGIVNNLCVDGVLFHVPIATEEPSVCAAASFGARLLGTMRTEYESPLQDAQVALYGVSAEGERRFTQTLPRLNSALMVFLERMHKRGGGLRGLYHYRTADDIFVVLLRVDVRDALGANAVNAAAEYLAPLVADCTGGQVLSAIVSNYSDVRLVRAFCEVDADRMALRKGEESAQRIVRMCEWAKADIRRAVTHNKGIMNGVSAFALATGNDTRALEAAAHAHAAETGVYRPLTNFEYCKETRYLRGSIEIPALFAAVGGGTAQPTAQWVRSVLGINYHKRVSAHVINRIAACLGLAQNFAALRALVSEGIQKGHMKLHARRKAGSTHD